MHDVILTVVGGLLLNYL